MPSESTQADKGIGSNFWLKFPAALAACIGFGSWAAWVNRSQPDWYHFAILQGSYAFASTLALQQLTLRCYLQIQSFRFARAMTWLIVSSVALLLPFSLQSLANNPATLPSIAPGAIASSFFVAGVLLSLRSS